MWGERQANTCTTSSSRLFLLLPTKVKSWLGNSLHHTRGRWWRKQKEPLYFKGLGKDTTPWALSSWLGWHRPLQHSYWEAALSAASEIPLWCLIRTHAPHWDSSSFWEEKQEILTCSFPDTSLCDFLLQLQLTWTQKVRDICFNPLVATWVWMQSQCPSCMPSKGQLTGAAVLLRHKSVNRCWKWREGGFSPSAQGGFPTTQHILTTLLFESLNLDRKNEQTLPM